MVCMQFSVTSIMLPMASARLVGDEPYPRFMVAKIKLVTARQGHAPVGTRYFIGGEEGRQPYVATDTAGARFDKLFT
jgi:hypothetical protein